MMNKDNGLVADALASEYVILSVMGPHAGEDEAAIYTRKMKEIEDEGFSLWVHSSTAARPEAVKRLCRRAADAHVTPYCLFIEPSSPGGAQPTANDRRAAEYSADKIHWQKVPPGINPTGNIGSKRTVALVFDGMWIVEGRVEVDLWDYSVFESPGEALRIAQGISTICAQKVPSIQDEKRLKSHVRRVTAIGRLKEPYSAWLR